MPRLAWLVRPSYACRGIRPELLLGGLADPGNIRERVLEQCWPSTVAEGLSATVGSWCGYGFLLALFLGFLVSRFCVFFPLAMMWSPLGLAVTLSKNADTGSNDPECARAALPSASNYVGAD